MRNHVLCGAKRQADDDGESYSVEVEARNADEAQEIAASQFDNVDYTMVQGCFAGW